MIDIQNEHIMKALNLIVVMAALAFAAYDKDTDETTTPTPVPPPVRIALHLQYKQKKFTSPFLIQRQYDVPSVPWNSKPGLH